MSSSISSSEPARPEPGSAEAGKTTAGNARLFLAAMAGGLVLAATAATLAPEQFIHSGPEFGMAEAFEVNLDALCARKATPDYLILGDSRAVAGVSVVAMRQAGLNVEKAALGGAGIFAGWAMLDRLIDCGVRPKNVLMAYGVTHMLDTGSIMERTINYDVIKGPRTAHVYAQLSDWEQRRARKLAVRAASIVGAGPSLLDLTLLRPALKNVLERPGHAIENFKESERGRAEFTDGQGDVYYGRSDHADGLPIEADFTGDIRSINYAATAAIADLGQDHGFKVFFYVMPLSDTARGLDPSIHAMAETFLAKLPALGVMPLNDVPYLPDDMFGDPSHVNPTGRALVTRDVLARLAGARIGLRGAQVDNPVAIAP